jgi:hypothetical protein
LITNLKINKKKTYYFGSPIITKSSKQEFFLPLTMNETNENSTNLPRFENGSNFFENEQVV